MKAHGSLIHYCQYDILCKLDRIYISVTPSTGDKSATGGNYKTSLQILRSGSISTSKRSIMTSSMMHNIGKKIKFKITLLELIFVLFIYFKLKMSHKFYYFNELE